MLPTPPTPAAPSQAPGGGRLGRGGGAGVGQAGVDGGAGAAAGGAGRRPRGGRRLLLHRPGRQEPQHAGEPGVAAACARHEGASTRALPCRQARRHQQRRRPLPRPALQAFVQTCAGLCGPDTRCLVAFERRAPEASLLQGVQHPAACLTLGRRVCPQPVLQAHAIDISPPFLPPCPSMCCPHLLSLPPFPPTHRFAHACWKRPKSCSRGSSKCRCRRQAWPVPTACVLCCCCTAATQ